MSDDRASRAGGLAGAAARLAGAAARLAVIGLVAAIAISFVPIWPLALFEHFRPHYAVAGLAIGAAAWGLARRGWFDAAAIGLLVNACVLIPDLGSSPRAAPAEGVRVRLLYANVLTTNTSHDALRRLIATARPDLVALVEVDPAWLTALAPALVEYPHRLAEPRADNFGIALYARAPLDGDITQLGSELPSIAAEVALDGARLGVLVTHPLPPISSAALAQQERHLDAVAARARAFTVPTVIAGDLNTTPWSRLFVRLLGASGLCDSRAGFGYQGSFPVSSAILRIPIDHVLVSCRIGVRDRRIGPDIGSDHFPVIVELVVPRR